MLHIFVFTSYFLHFSPGLCPEAHTVPVSLASFTCISSDRKKIVHNISVLSPCVLYSCMFSLFHLRPPHHYCYSTPFLEPYLWKCYTYSTIVTFLEHGNNGLEES